MKISKRTVLKGIGALSLGIVCAPLRVFALPLLGSYRFGNQSQTLTRFVLELPQNLTYRTMSLTNPNRLVIDVRSPIDLSVSAQSAPLGNVKSVRAGRFNGDYFRFVLDLSQPAILQKTFTLAPVGSAKYRFVFDIQNVSQATLNKTANLFSQASSVLAVQPQTETKNALIISAPKTKKRTIVLDPGHGGKDPGAIGKNKTREKDIVLAVGRQLREILKKKGYNVYMTRDSDHYLKLHERSQFAQVKKADLFLSIHADSNPNAKAEGFSVYTLSDQATDAESRKLAQRENAADLIGFSELGNYSKDVRSILTDFAQRQSIEEGIVFASLLVNGVEKENNIKSLSKTHRSAPFAVLKSTVPSVLAELGFLSNSREEQLLKSSQYQLKLAETIAKTIDQYPFT